MRIKIKISDKRTENKVFLDGMDITRSVKGVSIESNVGNPTQVTLKLININDLELEVDETHDISSNKEV